MLDESAILRWIMDEKASRCGFCDRELLVLYTVHKFNVQMPQNQWNVNLIKTQEVVGLSMLNSLVKPYSLFDTSADTPPSGNRKPWMQDKKGVTSVQCYCEEVPPAGQVN